jgi:LCP family protein required for cell wall assembly
LLICFTLTPLACVSTTENNPGASAPFSETTIPFQFILVTVSPDATPTATPFQPPQVNNEQTNLTGPGAIPTSGTGTIISRPWGDFAGPTIWPPSEIPPPAPFIPQPSSQTNILLLGDDQRPGTSGYRTDSIMLLILKPDQKSASLISFPRDLYVYIPGWTMNRINVILARGGFDLMQDTFAYNFGIRPEYYIRINVWAFGDIIDSLGGVDVNVAVPMTDEVPGEGYHTVQAGLVHMDGATAEWYTRARYATSDFDRTRRHQEVLQALFLKMLSLDALQNIPELYNTYQDNVTTNLTLENITHWLPLAIQLTDTSKVKQYLITHDDVSDWTVPTSGAWCCFPTGKRSSTKFWKLSSEG